MMTHLRHSVVLFLVILCCSLSSVIGSYDSAYGVGPEETYEPSYAGPPIVHGQGHGHQAGSYYHYHVPLVGQNHYQPYHHQSNDHHHLLLLLLPLLLLLGLPLLLLPLLPLFLLPLGLSLLALLMPGGMMMMMMMMMMMPMMTPPSIREGRGGVVQEMRSIGELVLGDMSSLMAKYARSLDLDKCPERVSCEMGMALFPRNTTTQAVTAKTLMNYIVDQAMPKGRTRRMLRAYREAFWTGSNSGNCTLYQCHPTFKIYQDTMGNPTTQSVQYDTGANAHLNTTNNNPGTSSYASEYYSQPVDTNSSSNNYVSSTQEQQQDGLQAYYDYYNKNAGNFPDTQSNEISRRLGYYRNVFGTPTIRS